MGLVCSSDEKKQMGKKQKESELKEHIDQNLKLSTNCIETTNSRNKSLIKFSVSFQPGDKQTEPKILDLKSETKWEKGMDTENPHQVKIKFLDVQKYIKMVEILRKERGLN